MKKQLLYFEVKKLSYKSKKILKSVLQIPKKQLLYFEVKKLSYKSKKILKSVLQIPKYTTLHLYQILLDSYNTL